MHHTILSRHLFRSLAENIVYIENAVCISSLEHVNGEKQILAGCSTTMIYCFKKWSLKRVIYCLYIIKNASSVRTTIVKDD